MCLFSLSFIFYFARVCVAYLDAQIDGSIDRVPSIARLLLARSVLLHVALERRPLGAHAPFNNVQGDSRSRHRHENTRIRHTRGSIESHWIQESTCQDDAKVRNFKLGDTTRARLSSVFDAHLRKDADSHEQATRMSLGHG